MSAAEEIPVHESTRKRRRWGCTCGCLVLFVLLFLAGIGLAVYLLRPVKAPSRPLWIGPETDAYGVLRLINDDKGMQALTNFLLKRTETRIKRQVPEQDRKSVAAAMTVARKSISQFIQSDLVAVLDYQAEPPQEDALAAVHFRNQFAVVLTSLFLNDRLVRLPDEQTTAGAPPIYAIVPDAQRAADAPPPSPSAVATVAGRTLFLSDSPTLLAQVASRALSSELSTEPPEDLQAYLDALALNQPPAGQDLAFAAVTPPGRIIGWLTMLENGLRVKGFVENLQDNLTKRKASLDDVQGITITGDVLSDNEVEFTASLYLKPVPDAPKRLSEALRLGLNQSLARIEEAEAGAGITTRLEVKQLGTVVVVGLRLNGLRKVVELLFPLPPEEATAQAPAEPAPEEEPPPPPAE